MADVTVPTRELPPLFWDLAGAGADDFVAAVGLHRIYMCVQLDQNQIRLD